MKTTMKTKRRRLAILFVSVASLLVSGPALHAQLSRHDPLNEHEIDALRDSREEPIKRLKLFVQFARQRMDRIDQLRSDPRLALDRGPELHDALRDLGSIVDEMDSNVDLYSDDKYDIRKALKEVVQADTEFQQKLGEMKQAALSNAKLSDEAKRDYQFVLDDTTDSINSSLKNATQTLSEQENLAKDKKHNPLRKPEE
jgi:hypothetical protein